MLGAEPRHVHIHVRASVAQLVEHLHGKEGVTGSNPVGGLPRRAAGSIVRCPRVAEIKIMAKAKVVELVALECIPCWEGAKPVHRRNYTTPKNRRNTQEKLDLNKYCPVCRRHTPHRETKVK